MNFQKLEIFQNDEILKDYLKKEFEYLNWIIVWTYWNKEHDNFYEKYTKKEEKKVYESLFEIKNNLDNEELNISLIYNRLLILTDNFLPPDLGHKHYIQYG